jgi:hypothetical protein
MNATTKRSYQDPRYLQLWLTFEWSKPADRIPVACADCDWHGRRVRRNAAARPCPRCTAPVLTRSARPRSARPPDRNVIALHDPRRRTLPN